MRELTEDPLVLLNVDEIAEAAEEACGWPAYARRSRSAPSRSRLPEAWWHRRGVAVLPDMTYRPWSLEGDRIEAREIVEAIPPVDVVVAWRRGAPLPVAGEQFIALVRAFRGGRSR